MIHTHVRKLEGKGVRSPLDAWREDFPLRQGCHPSSLSAATPDRAAHPLDPKRDGGRRSHRWQRLPADFHQALNHGLQLTIDLIQSSQRGDRPLFDLAGIIPVGLHKLNIAAAAGGGIFTCMPPRYQRS